MASIKGITIEIDGDTSELNKALRDVNATIKSTNSELRAMQKTAEFSSGFNGIKNWSQQQDVLKNMYGATWTLIEVYSFTHVHFHAHGERNE